MFRNLSLQMRLISLFVIVHLVGLTWEFNAGTSVASAADRTTHFFPLSPDAKPSPGAESGIDFASDISGAAGNESWSAYQRLWSEHHRSPSSPAIRKFLSLPVKTAVDVRPRRGRSAPDYLNWRPGSYQQIDTPHFQIFSRADPNAGKSIAIDLERCYWIWTQAFFPFWDGREQVSVALRQSERAETIEQHLAARNSRIRTRRRMRIVLFRDAAEYQSTLAPVMPGIEQSTGFYSEDRQTSFFYATSPDNAATRRHELVHQLFREATRTRLGRRTPGEDSGFWLVEGIAGYAESIWIGQDHATLGGWETSRLQFARYRVLANQDTMLMSKLTDPGRLAVQQQSDLARWYAHAIAQTHRLMDGGRPADRLWVYAQLAKLYDIDVPYVSDADPNESPSALADFLRINDQHLAANPPNRDVTQICLNGCEVTADGLTQLDTFASLDWLDLSRLGIGNDDVQRVVGRPEVLTQLSLEATHVDSGLSQFIRKCGSLSELDLSWTGINDAVVAAIPNSAPIETLWLTGTPVSDVSLRRIATMKSLTAVDLQRTKVTDKGLQQLKKSRPGLTVNPLQLRAPAK